MYGKKTFYLRSDMHFMLRIKKKKKSLSELHQHTCSSFHWDSLFAFVFTLFGSQNYACRRIHRQTSFFCREKKKYLHSNFRLNRWKRKRKKEPNMKQFHRKKGVWNITNSLKLPEGVQILLSIDGIHRAAMLQIWR